MFADCLAYTTAEWLTQGKSSLTQALDHLVVTNDCSISASKLEGGMQKLVPNKSHPENLVLSLRSTVDRRTAEQVKKEILNRYKDDGYYLLEACVDAIMKLGICKIGNY
jgi:outer membrane protein assembly factor BamA